MIRILIITAVSGFVLCAICLTSAAALGGTEIVKKGWTWGAWDVAIDEDNDKFSIVPAKDGRGSVVINGERVDEAGYANFWSGETVTREFSWAGSGELAIGMPADVTYTQGPTPGITVTGPSAAVDRFYVEGEDLRLRGWNASNTFSGIPTDDNINGGNRPPRLKIAVVAPGVTSFDLSGTETLTIENYAQDMIRLEVTGAAKVTAKGSARRAEVDINGAGFADLGGMTLDQAELDLSGASRATVGPKTLLDADLSGASRVTLTSRPAQIDRDLSGVSAIDEVSGPEPAPAKTK